MIATLSKSQAELPRLVEIASQGEDVLITVEGKPKARLTRAVTTTDEKSPAQIKTNLSDRLNELSALRDKYHTGKTSLTVDQILDEIRGNRF